MTMTLWRRHLRALQQAPVRYAQFGEDALLRDLFPRGATRTVVDVGANDGITGSNSLLLEQAGWRCLLIEPNPLLARRLRECRRGEVFECALSDHEGRATLRIVEGGPGADGLSSLESAASDHRRLKANGFTTRSVEVNIKRLDTLLEEAQIPGTIDVLSIDVEGHEATVLSGFDIRRWHPRLVVIEDNSDYADPIIPGIMRRSGYRRVFRSGVNAWYAREGDPDFDTPGNRAHIAIDSALAPLRRTARPAVRAILNMIRPWLETHPRIKGVIKTMKRRLGITRTFS